MSLINYTRHLTVPVINLSVETVEPLIGAGIMTDPYRLPDEAL